MLMHDYADVLMGQGHRAWSIRHGHWVIGNRLTADYFGIWDLLFGIFYVVYRFGYLLLILI